MTQQSHKNNDTKYQGEINDGKMHGLGTLEFIDEKFVSEIGGYLSEEYSDDEHDFIVSNPKVIYKGQFQDGKFCGDGELQFAEDWDYNYILFKGKFQDGKRNGYGLFMHGDFPFEGGEYKDDKLNGKGFIHHKWLDYEGEFKNGKYDGYGIEENQVTGQKYIGFFKDGMREGAGKLEFSDKRFYEGDFKKGKFNGYGTFIFANGEKYEGQFLNGKYNGFGTLYREDGTKLEGEFAENNYVTDKVGEQIISELSFHKRNNPGGLYLFVDTETTGLPKRLIVNGETHDAFEEEKNLLLYPRLVRLSYIIHDNSGTEILKSDFIIKPDHFLIPTDASNIHGITTEIANKKGQPLKSVLRHFRQVYDYTRFIVGHNIYFDTKVIAAEFLRNDIQDTFTNRNKLDTIGLSVDYCAIKGHHSYDHPDYPNYKYPTLSELHQKLFNNSFEGAHSSAVDVSIVAKCFWELKRQNVIYQDQYGSWTAKTR